MPMKKKLQGNLAMLVSKTFSGLNMNALKYLLPVWISPFTAVFIRMAFAAASFWIIGLFVKNEPPTTLRTRFYLFLLGAVGMSGYMTCYLLGLKYTTPVVSSIIQSLVPMWVFILSVCFLKEHFTGIKGLGLTMGFVGALLSMFSKKDPGMAPDPMLGDIFTLCSSLFYSVYLILSHLFLKKVGIITMLKWSFLGATFSTTFVTWIAGWHAPVLTEPFHLLPVLVLLFILIFPTVISYLLLPVGLKLLNPTVVSMYGYVVVAVATIAALLLGQDKFDWLMIVSILLLFGGLYFVEKGETQDAARRTHQIRAT
ncbi:MAG: DMT family transporter [Bacteroidales bacterium]